MTIDTRPLAAGAAGLLGGLCGGAIGSGVTPYTEFVFAQNPDPLITLEVRSLTEDTGSYVRFLWRGETVTLPTEGVKIRHAGDITYITASKSRFREAGIPVK